MLQRALTSADALSALPTCSRRDESQLISTRRMASVGFILPFTFLFMIPGP